MHPLPVGEWFFPTLPKRRLPLDNEAEPEAPREILLETKSDGRSLQVLQKVFESSKIRAETVSSDPIRVKLPATTRAVTVLLMLLEELKPEGSIIFDDGSAYSIDEGLSKLRRLAIRSLSSVEETEEEEKAPNLVREFAPEPSVVPTPLPETSKLPPSVEEHVERRSEFIRPLEHSPRPYPQEALRGFKSRDIALLTLAFLALISIAIGSATTLALAGRIGEVSIVLLLVICIVGALSIIHRYASAFKQGLS